MFMLRTDYWLTTDPVAVPEGRREVPGWQWYVVVPGLGVSSLGQGLEINNINNINDVAMPAFLCHKYTG